jgi:ABC-type oligopeptide transport system substrate-binding subunit/DNA-binding SARP family transcriptional activator/predicted Ser/Thr protein kinase
MTLVIHLLGPVQISRDGDPIDIPGHRPLALLAYLLATGVAHSRQHLVDLLFEGSDDPRASLRWTLSKLRRAIGADYLLADRHQVAFNFESDYWLDVATFEAGQLDLYRGDFLEGLHVREAYGFEDWVFFERERLRSCYQAALTQQLEECESRGDYAAVVETAHQLLRLDNLREDLHRALMGAYARLGKREAALAQYAQCRQVLGAELGVEPVTETIALAEAIQQGRPESVRPEPGRSRQLIAEHFSIDELEENLLGQGSMGEVYRGTDIRTGKPVAIKIIKPAIIASQPDMVKRFVREGEALRRLNHPNIVKMLAATEKGGRHYLIMEYVGGDSLCDLLAAEGRLPVERTVEIALDLCDALTRAHRLNIIHRDLKPANVLLAKDGTPRLTDFGIARMIDSPQLTETGVVMGTVDYLSPEACQGNRLDTRTDIWAFGVLLYEMLAGQRPFIGETLTATLTAILTQPVPDLIQQQPEVPDALANLIYRMLEKDPQQRIPSVRLVGAELEAILKGKGGVQALGHAEQVAPALDRLPGIPSKPPAFLEEAEEQVVNERAVAEGVRPVFVARERELARLDEHLKATLDGHGRVLFITGEAGRGKTALLAEFARRAQEAHAELIVASGNCNAYSGVGDPYLPFRDVMGLLSGDVEAKWAAGVITREHACRLWSLSSHTVQALVDDGPDLIDVFVSGAGLVRRAAARAPGGASWQKRLKELAEREKAVPGDLEQRQLFEQYTQVLCTLAARHPLLLMLDDLQWADTASINLLFHLGRRLGGSRILILGAYRPSEVALGRPSAGWGGEGRHPLEPVINEFKRLFGDIHLDLGQMTPAEGREFVDAFLNTEPNRLGEDFRQALFRHTRGHPLFTIELLRDMQERGDLIQDEEGRWIEGPALAWEALPARVEAVIEGRIGRLESELRDILTVASVEGEDFTAQVVARVQEIGERQLLRQLSQELEKRHGLVRERGEVRVGRQRLSRYRFGHVLFQQYLYNGLSLGERRLLHGEIAALLEELYAGCTDQIAVQLARHYAEAGEGEKAVDYLLQAGDQARLAYAHQEAVDHYQRALAFLKEQGAAGHERAARTLMKLGLTYHTAFDFRRARRAYEEGFALWQRAGEIREGVPPPAPHALRVNAGEPRTLDLTVADDIRSRSVIVQLFSGLVELSPELSVVPHVARSWEVSEGGRRYVFHLRDDVRWSDGAPVMAGDFEYGWKRTLDPATGSLNASLLYDIKGARAFHRGEAGRGDVGVRALDAVTLAVELEGPTGYFLHLLASCACYPVPRHVVEAHGKAWTEVGNIVTNGPFRLEAWRQGQSMVLARNSDYHGRCRGNLQRMEFSFHVDPDAIVEMYEADGLDILDLWYFLPSEIDRARQRRAGEYVTVPRLSTFYVGFNVSRPPFDDPRVRRAFALATDRETLADVVLRGYISPATGGFIPPGMPGHSARIGLPYDPEQARQLLAEAGYSKGHDFPAVNWLLARGYEPVAEYLQAQWRENLRVEIRWETMEYAVLLDRVDMDPPPIFHKGWAADYPDPDNFLRVSFVRLQSRWRNEAYDKLVEEARRVMDHGERMEPYRQADRILVEEAVIIPLTYDRGHLLVKPWVSKFPMSPMKWNFWKDVIIEPH